MRGPFLAAYSVYGLVTPTDVYQALDHSSALSIFYLSKNSTIFTIFVIRLNDFLTSAELYRCLESHSTCFVLSMHE